MCSSWNKTEMTRFNDGGENAADFGARAENHVEGLLEKGFLADFVVRSPFC